MSQLLNADSVKKEANASEKESTFLVPFGFDLPPCLQTSITIKHGHCHYFIKAYIISDSHVLSHYKRDVNVFDEFFLKLNHTLCKQVVQITNSRVLSNGAYTELHQVFDANTNNFKVVVTLPKVTFAKGEVIPIHVLIQHVNEDAHENKIHLDLRKIEFKLVEYVKLTSVFPVERVRISEHTIASKRRRNLHEDKSHVITVEENFELPKDCQSSSSKLVTGKITFITCPTRETTPSTISLTWRPTSSIQSKSNTNFAWSSGSRFSKTSST